MSAPVVVADEAGAYLFLEQQRWGGAPDTCPHCEHAGRCYFLQPRDPVGRRTRTGAVSARRIWKCGACRRQFSVLTGTVLEGTRISVLDWLALIADTCDGQAAATASTKLSSEARRRGRARLAAACDSSAMRSRLARVRGDHAV